MADHCDVCEHEHGYGAIIPAAPARLAADEQEPVAAGTPPPDTDLEEMDTPIQDQGSIGSCTAFGGCATLEHEQRRLGYPQVTKLCELDLYYRDRQVIGLDTNQDTGSYPDAVLQACKVYGVCPEEDRPYDPARFREAPDANMVAHEGQFKVTEGHKLTGDVVANMWDCIRNRVPFYICFNVYESFERVGNDGIVPLPRQGERILGGHCVKGGSGWFNNRAAAGGIGYFKCKNSWGTVHGDRGYYYFPTAYFTSGVVTDVYVMTLPAPSAPTEDHTQNIIDNATEVQRLVTDAQNSGWASPSVQSSLGAIKNYMDYIIYDVEFTPIPGSAQGDVKDICWEVQRLVAIAQNSGWGTPEVRSYLGSIKDYMNQVMALVQQPPPPPSSGVAMPIDPGAIIGQSKWYTGPDSPYGCDMFCPDNAPLYAVVDGVIEEIIGGQGISGGAEIILSKVDKSWAFRHRHVQARAGLRVGDHVKAGDLIGKVHDTSLNQLCPQPVAGFPAGWQHNDFSVNKGTDRFSPTGGCGGNYPAYQWLAENKYQASRVMARTPGPTSCGFTQTQASKFIETGAYPATVGVDDDA